MIFHFKSDVGYSANEEQELDAATVCTSGKSRWMKEPLIPDLNGQNRQDLITMTEDKGPCGTPPTHPSPDWESWQRWEPGPKRPMFKLHLE